MDTVEEYLESLPADVRPVLSRIRKAIVEAAPKAKEEISYNMPGYTYFGPLVYFAAYKKHCSLFGISKAIRTTFSEELADFKINNTTIQFTCTKPRPVALVKKMVSARVKENEIKQKSGAAKKT